MPIVPLRTSDYQIATAVASAGAGTGVAIAGVANRRIRVLSYTLSVAAAGTATWRSNTTNLTGPIGPFAVEAGFNPLGWFECATGQDLRLNATAGAGGHVTAAFVPAPDTTTGVFP